MAIHPCERQVLEGLPNRNLGADKFEAWKLIQILDFEFWI
jgi:hypothetical protein